MSSARERAKARARAASIVAAEESKRDMTFEEVSFHAIHEYLRSNELAMHSLGSE